MWIERHPIITLLIAFLVMITALQAITDTATVEVINGTQYITEINGEAIDPRRPNRYDTELHWEYK